MKIRTRLSLPGMMDLRRRLGTDRLWIPLGRGLLLLATLVGARVLTEIVPPREYGKLALVTGLIALGTVVLYASLTKAATRSVWDYYHRGQMGTFGTDVLVLFILVSVAMVLGIWLASSLGLSTGLGHPTVALVLPVYLIANPAAAVLLNLLNTLQRHRAYVVGATVQAWLMPGLAILMVMLLGPTAESILLGYAVCAVVVLLGVLARMSFDGTLRIPSAESQADTVRVWKAMASYATPLMLVNFLYWVQTTANRYVLNASMSVETVGLYVVAASVGSMGITSIESVFIQIHQPILYRQIGSHPGQDVDTSVLSQAMDDYIRAFFVLVTPCVLFTMVGGHWLIQALAGKMYWSGSIVIPWIAAAEYMRSLSAVVAVGFEVKCEPQRLVGPIAVSAPIALITTALVAPSTGIMGAAMGVFCGALALFGLNYWKARKQLAFWRLPGKTVFVAVASSGAIAFLSWLAATLVSRMGSLVQLVVFVAVFGVGYIVYAGRSILAYKPS